MIRLCALLLVLPGLAQANCRQALSLALDVSSSVDDREYRLQLDGVIAAINAPAVQDILFLQPDAPIRLHVYEWSGPINQTIIVPWTGIETPADLIRVSAALRQHTRGVAAPTTSIGAAMLAGFSYLEQQPDCWKRTLDISGDGETNTGLLPERITDAQIPVGIVVNGLVIGAGDGNHFVDIKQLTSYYQTKVIRGAGAFVEVALGYEAYAATMERKLLRELASFIVGDAAETGARLTP